MNVYCVSFCGQIFEWAANLGALLYPKICCYVENLSIDYFTFSSFYSADKLSNEQQIFGLNQPTMHVVTVYSKLTIVMRCCKLVICVWSNWTSFDAIKICSYQFLRQYNNSKTKAFFSHESKNFWNTVKI